MVTYELHVAHLSCDRPNKNQMQIKAAWVFEEVFSKKQNKVELLRGSLGGRQEAK